METNVVRLSCLLFFVLLAAGLVVREQRGEIRRLRAQKISAEAARDDAMAQWEKTQNELLVSREQLLADATARIHDRRVLEQTVEFCWEKVRWIDLLEKRNLQPSPHTILDVLVSYKTAVRIARECREENVALWRRLADRHTCLPERQVRGP